MKWVSLLKNKKKRLKDLKDKFNRRARESGSGPENLQSTGLPAEAVVKTIQFSLSRVEYEFWGERFSFNTAAIFFLLESSV